jgi:hypothetical protein
VDPDRRSTTTQSKTSGSTASPENTSSKSATSGFGWAQAIRCSDRDAFRTRLSMMVRGRRILVGFTPAVRIEQFFRDLEKRGEYFGNGSPQDKELVHRLYGIVNVGPPLRL